MKLQLWEMTKMKQKIKNIYSTKYLNSVRHEKYFRYIKDLNHI